MLRHRAGSAPVCRDVAVPRRILRGRDHLCALAGQRPGRRGALGQHQRAQPGAPPGRLPGRVRVRPGWIVTHLAVPHRAGPVRRQSPARQLPHVPDLRRRPARRHAGQRRHRRVPGLARHAARSRPLPDRRRAVLRCRRRCRGRPAVGHLAYPGRSGARLRRADLRRPDLRRSWPPGGRGSGPPDGADHRRSRGQPAPLATATTSTHIVAPGWRLTTGTGLSAGAGTASEPGP